MDKKLKNFDYAKYGKLALFAELNSAFEDRNFKKAAEAQSELKKLGIIVQFKRKSNQSERGFADADKNINN